MKSLIINDIKFSVDLYAENILRLFPTKHSKHVSLPLLAETILRKNLPYINNIVGTKTEILLFTNVNTSTLRKELKGLKLKIKQKPRQFTLPICFSKATDWKSVEKMSGISKSSYLDQLLQTNVSLSMYGFLPGFMYLDGLTEPLQIQRKSKPVKKVAAGSFAIGGPYAGIYNIDSPGGWHVIGNCPIQLFNAASILSPFVNIGDTFTLKKITQAEWKTLNTDSLNLKSYNE